MECTPPCQRESPPLCALHTPRNPSHGNSNHSMENKKKYDRKSDKLVAPKCQKRLLAESGAVLVEDLKRWNKIQRYEGDRMNPEEERVLQYKEKENKLGKDLVCWVHPQDGQ